MSKLFSFRRGCVASLLALQLAGVAPAWAKRPFDGTDADTVPPEELEVALGVGSLKPKGEASILTAPSAVLTYGLKPGWEIGVEAGHGHRLGSEGGSFVADGAVASKLLLREGGMQGKSGASIAGELVLLLPDSDGGSHVGAGWTTIVSFRTKPFDLHLNGSLELTREGTAEAAGSVILEFLPDRAVHPVTEISYRNEFSHSQGASALAGMVWDLHEDLSLDLAVRRGWSGGPETEFRLGMTFVIR